MSFLKIKVESHNTWVDKDQEIFNQAFTRSVYICGVRVYRRYFNSSHDLKSCERGNKVGFK